ncbi:N-acetyltransferase family protein [Providencia vermicola]|uniref:GNAT family N-acetyltransferase n=2 Tax=Providencia TaxID=586 RepID=A0AAI9I0P0_PROST|nr:MULTISPECIES: GNAT family N-acetyltransferase [Providencia]ELR5044398.1 GNAT family N-acetyltransferase [Providencia rettgeri]ELR5036089.1 GNAT family N-acetyltransferase [Providencia stuartii]ELR5120711.1 GNAT family N-acetyltransferase [Providencia stuartii]ELR5144378.1 GNAT family N-acetyltransferase [Providencia stuartii]ELR5293299.1 GNAT family N-acetyltransferase [Providencia stuartii]
MIRCAVKQDLEAVLSLYELLFSEMANLDSERMQPAKQAREFVEHAISDEKFQLLVAEHDGKVKGFCLAQQQSASPYNCMVPRDFCYIFDLVVAPELRSQKMGHQFLEHMKIWAKERNLSHLELSVLSQNHQAIKFYEREGLTEITRTMGIKL